MKAKFIHPTNPPGDPVIENIRFDGQPDQQSSERLKTLFDEDQRPASEPVEWTDMDPQKVIDQLGSHFMEKADRDARRRRVEVLELLQQGKINLAPDLYHAAMIFQHGNCAPLQTGKRAGRAFHGSWICAGALVICGFS